MTVTSLPREWIVTPFLRLLFQNLVVEERADIRAVTLTAWRTALEVVADVPGWMKKLVKQQTVLDWYSTMMTPLGAPIDCSTFYFPAFTEDDSDTGPLERHNVDKNMLAQDLSLVSAEVIMQARIAAATSMAYLMIYWPPKVLCFSAWFWFCSDSFAVHRRAFPTHTCALLAVNQHASEILGCPRLRGMGPRI